jgi:endonuclease YncB( thermonuclease family)
MRRFTQVLAFFFMASVGHAAAGMTGHLVPNRSILDVQVVDVLSGDTVTISIEGRGTVTVHLHGIAAPHSEQPYGARAKEELTKLVLGKVADVYVDLVESQEEVAGIIFVATDKAGVKTNANIEMIRRGYAWYDTRSGLVKKPKDNSLERNMELDDFERESKEAHRGLWADKSPVPPWKWGTKLPNQLPDPTSPSVTPAAGAAGAPSVAADH